MTLIFMDGFDDQLFLNGKWDQLNSSPTYNAAGRNGGCFQTNNGSTNIVKFLKPADEHATLIIGFAYKATNLGINPILSLRSDAGATTHTQLYTDTGGTLSVRRNTTALTTSTNQILVNQWYYIEFKCTLGAAGYYEVRVNGVVWTSGTNNTKNAGTKTVYDTFALVSSTSLNSYFDDLYVLNGAGSTNNNFLGDVAIETLLPNGNGSSSQWVGSDSDSVNNYLLVNENPAVTTNYTASNVVGNRDLYAVADMGRTNGTIYGVQTTAYVGNSDAVARTVKQVVKSGLTTSVDASAITVTTTYAAPQRVLENDPSTSTAWTIAGVNAMEAGIEVAS